MFKKNITLILIYTFLSFLLAFLSKEILEIDKLLKLTLSEYLTEEQIIKSFNSENNYKFLAYIILPILFTLKVSIISATLDVGCFISGKDIKFKKLLNIVVKAEFVFLLVIVFKTAWFYFFQTDFTFETLQNFYPLSALNIVGYQGLEDWFIYPFQILNLFEVAYWFILAYLISKEINDTVEKGLSIVASSYGVGLLIWVVGIMFLTLNIS